MGLGRHWHVFTAALAEDRAARQARKAGHGERHGDELAFLPAALEVVETPASPLARGTMIAICAFLTIAVGWSVIGEMDIIATAQGRIIPSERVKVIQPRDTGVVRTIYVRENQAVRAGDLLIELDATEADADLERLERELITARVEAARLTALLAEDSEYAYVAPFGAPPDLVDLHRGYLQSQDREHQAALATLDAEIARRQAALRGIEAEIGRLERVLPNIRERVAGRRELMERRFAARLAYLELEQELIETEESLVVERHRLAEATAALEAVRVQRRQLDAEFRRGVMESLAEVQQRASAAEQELRKAEERARLTVLIAPVDGVVQQLAVHTVGGVVTPAEPLMVIVPAWSGLEIEANVLNKDSGFVREGQPVEVKVESFPFTKYGTIPGTVLHVSEDAVEDETLGLTYPTRMAMARTDILVDDAMVPLQSGMAVTVEIKTGKRKVIEYLLAPLQEYQDESLRER